MKKLNLRLRFIYWLRDIAKVPDAEISPKWITCIYAILFPLRAIYAKQKTFNFDMARNVLTIGKIEYSMHMFDQFSRMLAPGDIFQFIARETTYGKSVITLKTEPTKRCKILAVLSGGDWADASVEHLVNLTDKTGDSLIREYDLNGGYHGNGKLWFKQWAIEKGYCREPDVNELEVCSD